MIYLLSHVYPRADFKIEVASWGNYSFIGLLNRVGASVIHADSVVLFVIPDSFLRIWRSALDGERFELIDLLTFDHVTMRFYPP